MIYLKLKKLNPRDYEKYGEVITPQKEKYTRKANMGTADRYDFLVPLKNLRASKAKANFCVFDCRPMIRKGSKTFNVKLLERHKYSTQVFIPMGNVRRYLVVVATGGEKPNLKTLRAFVASGEQGISYKPGIWHHPLIAIDKNSTFSCLIWEDGTKGDCEVQSLQTFGVVKIQLSRN